MKRKNSKFQIANFKLIFFLSFLLFTFHFLLFTSAARAADWGGVDESVVEKYAEEHGRAARDPIINTDQGDLLLFVFLLAGTVGGFIGGYNWRKLMEAGGSRDKEKALKHRKVKVQNSKTT